ncbi:hypothetical protein QOZ80_6AG0550250 [Eleusine coracana subsp. coracana]|nr:hypothetical protein QOZ80_6AG0550250 [Eleusine coracana subsp. coracana]
MPKETLNLRREELHHRESEKHEEPEVCKERDHSNKPDQLRLKAYGHPKKSNRLVWTVELHEKFLEAIEVLGGKYAVPSRILKQMNVKNLTLMHVASHLQKHRLRQPKANQDWKFQQNVNSKPAPLLVRSEHIAFATESITPRVAADIREVYPSRLSTNIKKMSAEPAALEAYSYTRTPGIFRNDTMTVWDKYHKSLKNDFYWSSIRHRYEQSAKSQDIARDEGVSSEGPKIAGEMSYGGAPFESPGSNSLLTSCLGQTEKTNLTEIAGNNNNVGDTAVMDPSDALLDDTNKSFSAQMYQTGPADNTEEMNSFWMSQIEGPQGQLNIKPEDLLQVDEAWNEALVLGTKQSLINIVEPMTREATVGFTLPDPVMQFAQTQEAAAGDAPMPDPVMQFPQMQEAAAEDAPMPDPVMQSAQTQEASVGDAPPPVLDYAALFAQDDIYWSWSPLVGDYDMLL